ncbi:MAG: DNA-binding protein [Lacisediminihabitans sp.]
MLVITADQVGSRGGADRAGSTLEELNRRFGNELVLPVDRNAGDEIQVIAPNGTTALEIILTLTRDGNWSVGLGAGAIRMPLPHATREASGGAFIAARSAIVRAKKRATRFAAEAQSEYGTRPTGATAADAEAVIDLLLTLRARRTEEGWELFDGITSGLNQNEVARKLGVSAQAVSSRAKIAGIRIELASYPALARLLDDLDLANNEHQNAEESA